MGRKATHFAINACFPSLRASFTFADMLRRILILPALALIIGLCVNAMHPLGVRWSGGRIGDASTQTGETLEPPVDYDPKKAVMPEGVSIDEAREWMKRERVVLIDIRSVAAYKAVHIPGAVSLPMPEEFHDALPELLRRYGKQTPLLLYCDSDACPRAMDVALALINERRYTNVRYLAGGFSAWEDAGSVPLVPESRP